jgi:hypothetical protein
VQTKSTEEEIRVSSLQFVRKLSGFARRFIAGCGDRSLPVRPNRAGPLSSAHRSNEGRPSPAVLWSDPNLPRGTDVRRLAGGASRIRTPGPTCDGIAVKHRNLVSAVPMVENPACSSGKSPANLTSSSEASHGRSQRLAQLPEVPGPQSLSRDRDRHDDFGGAD